MKLNVKPNTIPLLLGITFLGLALLIEGFQILKINQGHFVYTLDDAYIHLALAENILQGHYGVNLAEFSAPSSSILWPFLLAPFARVELAALVLNILAAFATVWVYTKILVQAFVIRLKGIQVFIITLILVLLILSTNLIGLVFSGMEHSLQVLVVAVIVWGLILVINENRVESWLLIAIGIAPMIRYENLAVSMAALLFLGLNKQYLKSLLVFTAIVVSLGLFSIFLLANGQAIIPASVLAKSTLMNEGFIDSFLSNLFYNLQTWFGVVSIILIVFLAALILLAKMNLNRRRLALVTILGVVLHLIFGRTGWYRYEIYALTFLSLSTIYLVGSLISPKLDQPRPLKSLALFTTLVSISLVFSNLPYIMLLAYVPTSSNNVFSQHYQMHRFATDYFQGSSAANDIGYLTYKNDAYVLDLYGLASIEAYRFRMAGEPDNWMGTLCAEYDIELVMIYEDWYPDIPASWVKVGDLIYSGRKITIANPTVAFFATSAEAAETIQKDLQDFIPTLPESSTFVFTP
ncbi:MAG: hypothetical protein ACYC6H_08890 [Bellilinea sp.]